METQVKELMCKDVGRGAMAKVQDIMNVVSKYVLKCNEKE